MIVPLTTTGARRLRDELEHLKSVKRPAVINAIAEARAHGDLKENAEYHAAREQQGFIEGRFKQLEAELSHAQVIDVAVRSSTRARRPHLGQRRGSSRPAMVHLSPGRRWASRVPDESPRPSLPSPDADPDA